jgi:hypothetical protein
MKAQEVDGETYYTIENLQDLNTLRNEGWSVLLMEPWKDDVIRLTLTYISRPGRRSELRQFYCDKDTLENFVIALETEAKGVYDKAVKDAETWWPPKPKERTGT